MDVGEVFKVLSQMAGSPVGKLLGVLAGLLGGPLLLIRFWNALSTLVRNRKAARIEKSIAAMTGVSAFTEADIANACRNYIEPNCTAADPSDEEDLRNVVALAPIFKTVDEHLERGGERRHIIILADSGMGKTSFCINYYAREKKKKKKSRRRIAIVPLGAGDPIRQIESLERKNETVLFLDALDEDPLASSDPQERLRQLMLCASHFKNVIITCRSQFFENDERIPKGSGIMYAGARRAGVSREYPLHKLFLAPFNPAQVRSYLAKSFPLLAIRGIQGRRHARSLVEAIPELSVRPMLLELVPELVREKRSIDQLYGLYEFLIEKWLGRERDWISERDLMEISIELAVQIFIKQRKGNGDRMSAAELEFIAADHNSEIASWKLKSRSLLNRDTFGNFKFAHRSVMEFLVLEACLRGDERALSVEWTDLMKDLLVSLANTDRESERRTLQLLSSDLGKAKVFPLATSVRMPGRFSSSECREIIKSNSFSRRHQRPIPAAWRGLRYRVSCLSNTPRVSCYSIVDQTHGISWLINNFSSRGSRDAELYLEPFSKNVPVSQHLASLMDVSDGATFRNPSIEEVLTLWQCELDVCRIHGIDRIFDTNHLYWIADMVDDSLLCCSFGRVPFSLDELRLIDSRVDSEGRAFHVYELLGKFGRYGMVNRLKYRALCAQVLEIEL